MSLTYEPEFAQLFAETGRPGIPPPATADWRAVRAATEAKMIEINASLGRFSSVRVESFEATGADGAAVGLRWYRKAGTRPGSAVVYAHGGGRIACSLDHYDGVIKRYVDLSGVPFLGVDYRIAPEAAAETPSRDVFAALGWLTAHATELDVDPARIAVMGDSGGGGPAAGAGILARDHGIPIARQLLVYPMLDDRNVVPDPNLAELARWSYQANATAWGAVLGDHAGSDAVSPLAAPARLHDHAGLAPAFLDVGELDIFRDETVAYAGRLMASGVSVELHVRAGAPHAFENLLPRAQLSLRAMSDRVAALTQL